jgi:uncharacterized protein (UPF0335 family)
MITSVTNQPEIVGAFVSIPKCASKTILEMFKLGINRDKHSIEKTPQFIIYENHQRLNVLENKYNLENKYIFTFVRNPYDRIKSWYYYHKTYEPRLEPYRSKSLNEWIQDGCKTHWRILNETNWVSENISPLLQYNFIDGKTKMNYIGKIENFEEDCKNIISEINQIMKENNYEGRLKYKAIKTNKSDRSHEETISDANKDLIYHMFKKDFDYFQYDK